MIHFLKDGATIYANEGNDTINFDGTAENGAKIQGNRGYDTINIKSGAVIDNSSVYGDGKNENYIFDAGNEINIDGTVRNNSKVYGGAGADTVNINGTVENSFIDTRSGDDIITIGDNLKMSQNSIITGGEGNDVISNRQKCKIDGSSTIDGGSGSDTLIISDSSVDFSNVKNFEKLALGGKIQSNGLITDDNTDVTLKLTTDHVKNILQGSNTDTLKIYGNSGDELNITKDFKDTNSSNTIGNETFKVYESISDPSIKIEIQDQVHVI